MAACESEREREIERERERAAGWRGEAHKGKNPTQKMWGFGHYPASPVMRPCCRSDSAR